MATTLLDNLEGPPLPLGLSHRVGMWHHAQAVIMLIMPGPTPRPPPPKKKMMVDLQKIQGVH